MQTTCGVYIFNPDNDLLICHPTEMPGHPWSIPKGLPDNLEPMFDAAIREVREETGIDLKPISRYLEYVGMQPYTNKDKMLAAYTINLLQHIPIDKLHCDSLFRSRISGDRIPEVEAFRWVQFDEFKHDIQPEQVALWERCRISP